MSFRIFKENKNSLYLNFLERQNCYLFKGMKYYAWPTWIVIHLDLFFKLNTHIFYKKKYIVYTLVHIWTDLPF